MPLTALDVSFYSLKRARMYNNVGLTKFTHSDWLLLFSRNLRKLIIILEFFTRMDNKIMVRYAEIQHTMLPYKRSSNLQGITKVTDHIIGLVMANPLFVASPDVFNLLIFILDFCREWTAR